MSRPRHWICWSTPISSISSPIPNQHNLHLHVSSSHVRIVAALTAASYYTIARSCKIHTISTERLTRALVSAPFDSNQPEGVRRAMSLFQFVPRSREGQRSASLSADRKAQLPRARSPLARGQRFDRTHFACLPLAPAAPFDKAQFPIKADDGDLIANFGLSPEMAARLAKLPGQIAVSNLQGDYLASNSTISIVPAAANRGDLDTLARTDKKLNRYSCLTVFSVRRCDVLWSRSAPRKADTGAIPQFHHRIYAAAASSTAPRCSRRKDVGLDQQKLSAPRQHAGHVRCPARQYRHRRRRRQARRDAAYVIGGVAVLGRSGLKPLQAMIADARLRQGRC